MGLCEMNVRVKERFGKPGEIAMQLASSMAGYALGGSDAQRYDSLVDAARNGRCGKECTELYPKCVARSEGGQLPALLRLASRLVNKKQKKHILKNHPKKKKKKKKKKKS